MDRLALLSSRISSKPLQGKTVVITGGSRGIGLYIAIRCAQDGANVAILAKTTDPHPKLPGTIFTAVKAIEEAGGKGLPLACDIRNQANVKDCIQKVVQTFGGIDILVNNASAISLTPTLQTDMKKYDLMHQINIRGTFLVSKECLPYLIKSKNPHILNISPPLNLESKWFSGHVAYSMAKIGMSMCVLGMAEEFKSEGVAVNALWPKTAIATAAVKNLLGGDEAIKKSRNGLIMADSAHLIFSSKSKENTGNFYIDEEVLRKHGVTDFMKYRFIQDGKVSESELIPDFFI